MIKIGVVGASGYTARQLLKILVAHPNAEIVRVTSRSPGDSSIANLHPMLSGQLDLPLVSFDVNDFVDAGVECAFSCLPHAASANVVKQLSENGIKVVDFSADYRLNDWQSFESCYQVEHPDRERVGKVPYGLPEIFRESITGQDLVANPGCFPTSAILPIVPLVKMGLVETDEIIVDSKSGVSGAGRNPKPHLHFPECNESVLAYAVGTHRHGPEMEQIIERATGVRTGIIFTPHLIPMERGILSTIYFRPVEGVSSAEIKTRLSDFYSDEPFVRIREQLHSTAAVAHTNFCDVTVAQHKDRVVVVASIDNLVKGASGAAVQNLNLMFGLPETTGLV